MSNAETRETLHASRPCGTGETSLQPCQDLWDYARDYARQRPEVVAAWCLGIGFILGWKLKPW